MDAKITALLDSSNPQDRKKAIKMLAQLGNQEALRKLAEIYKYDDDPEIKDLAIRAGKFIKTQTTAEFVATKTSTTTQERAVAKPAKSATGSLLSRSTATVPKITINDPVEAEEEFKPVFISPLREEEASKLLEQSSDASIKGEHHTAIYLVVKAFKTNPNYRLDDEAMRIALDVTQVSRAEFLAMLEDDQLVNAAVRKARGEKQKKVEKPKRKFGERDANGDKPWDRIFVEFGGFLLALVGMGVLFLIGASGTYYGAVNTLAQGCPGCTPAQVARLTYIVQQTKPLMTYTVGQIFVYATSLSAVLFTMLCVYYFAFHAVARIVVMSFEGSLRGMLDYCARFDIAWQTLSVFLTLFAYSLVLRDAFNPYLTPAMMSGTSFWEVLLYLNAIVYFGGWLWSVSRRMTYYNIGCFQVTCAIFLTAMVTSWVLANVFASVEAQYAASLKALFQ